jgi:aminopeptidase N
MSTGPRARCAFRMALLFACWLSAPAVAIGGTSAKALQIEHYGLQLSFDPDAKTVSGSVDIELRCCSAGGRQLSVDMAPELNARSVSFDGAVVRFRHIGAMLIVSLPGSLDAHRSHTLGIDYAAPAGPHLRFDNIAGKPTIASYGMPYSAMTWWPTFDHPALKASGGADIIISAPKGDVAVSNGILVGADRLKSGEVRYHWHESYPIYPDVISVAVGPYREVRATFHSITGRSIPLIFYVFQRDMSRVLPQLRAVPKILSRYEDLFGPYPFQRDKYGVAEMTIPSFREHQTVPSIGRGLLLGRTPIWDLHTVQNVIAHDMAHQWFGDSLTPKHWSDVWLNEGFANYAVALWHETTGGPPALRRFMRGLDTQPFKGSIYIASNEPRADLLTHTTFNKGAWVLHMLRHVMGDKAFFGALREYAQNNRGGLVDTQTWLAVCERQYGHPLGWFFREWIYGNGRPALHLQWREGSSSAGTVELVIRQTQKGALFKMPIDLELVTNGGSETRTVWIRERTEHFNISVSAPVSKVVVDPGYWVLLKR